MRFLPLTAVVLGLSLALPAQAAVDAAQWLGRMAQAQRLQSYQGTFIYARAGTFSTHEIWHRADNGQVTERLLRLDGPALETVRVNGRAHCQDGALLAGGVGAGQPTLQPLDPLRLMSWYTLAVVGESRVAARPAVIITLRPRDQQRYGVELHLDKETGLLLESLTLAPSGRLLERFQFTRFQPDRPSDSALVATKRCQGRVAIALGQPTPTPGWRSEWLPSGFALVGSSQRVDPQRKVLVSSLVYDDGLAAFSVFIEQLAGSNPSETRVQFGPTAAVSRRLESSKGELLVTVVGEVPIGTAERVALSVRPEVSTVAH